MGSQIKHNNIIAYNIDDLAVGVPFAVSDREGHVCESVVGAPQEGQARLRDEDAQEKIHNREEPIEKHHDREKHTLRDQPSLSR